MLDEDLAELFEVEVKYLNRAAARNSNRFPEDFRFQLDDREYEFLGHPIDTNKSGSGRHRKYLPWAFTEHGVAMLSCVLNSKNSVQVNISIARAFGVRQGAGADRNLAQKIEYFETRFDALKNQNAEHFQILLDAIKNTAVTIPHSKQSVAVSANVESDPIESPFVERRSGDDCEAISKAVAKYFGLKAQDLKHVTRMKTISLPRQIAMYLVRRRTGMSFRETGSFFGGKDHTTVLHAYTKISVGIGKDKKISEAVKSIEANLNRIHPQSLQ